jgi:hypothetical protein
MDAIAAPLRRAGGGEGASAAAGAQEGGAAGSAGGERVVTVAELLAYDPDDPDNDLDKYIV